MAGQKVLTAGNQGSAGSTLGTNFLAKTILTSCLTDEVLEHAVSNNIEDFLRFLLKHSGVMDLTFDVPGGLKLHVREHRGGRLEYLTLWPNGVNVEHMDLAEAIMAINSQLDKEAREARALVPANGMNGCDDFSYDQIPE